MLWTILVVLLILWLLGFSLNIAGNLVHVLLVVALVILVYQPDKPPALRLERKPCHSVFTSADSPS